MGKHAGGNGQTPLYGVTFEWKHTYQNINTGMSAERGLGSYRLSLIIAPLLSHAASGIPSEDGEEPRWKSASAKVTAMSCH